MKKIVYSIFSVVLILVLLFLGTFILADLGIKRIADCLPLLFVYWLVLCAIDLTAIWTSGKGLTKIPFFILLGLGVLALALALILFLTIEPKRFVHEAVRDTAFPIALGMLIKALMNEKKERNGWFAYVSVPAIIGPALYLIYFVVVGIFEINWAYYVAVYGIIGLLYVVYILKFFKDGCLRGLGAPKAAEAKPAPVPEVKPVEEAKPAEPEVKEAAPEAPEEEAKESAE